MFWSASAWRSIFRARTSDAAGRGDTGLYGEEAAARYLAHAGCAVLARRWRPKKYQEGEIDLVVREGDEIVFVEVKTRRTADFGPPEEAVTAFKRGQLRRLAAAWLAEAGGRGPRRHRIDVIAVSLTPAGRARLRHIRSAVGEAD